jgi:hypothetical protein
MGRNRQNSKWASDNNCLMEACGPFSVVAGSFTRDAASEEYDKIFVIFLITY